MHSPRPPAGLEGPVLLRQKKEGRRNGEKRK